MDYLVVILIFALVIFFLSRHKEHICGLERYHQKLKYQKEKRLYQIVSLLKEKEKITNNDVKNLLNISDATATRYLEELEKKGVIEAKGKGRGVFYQFKKII